MKVHCFHIESLSPSISRFETMPYFRIFDEEERKQIKPNRLRADYVPVKSSPRMLIPSQTLRPSVPIYLKKIPINGRKRLT